MNWAELEILASRLRDPSNGDDVATRDRAAHAIDWLSNETRRLRARVGRMRRSLNQLNKAHAILWKVVGLQADRIHGKRPTPGEP